MNETGIVPYGLAANWCEECGRPKMNRLLGILTGCPACDEVITRHRCTGRPPLDDMMIGEWWMCGECGSTWTAVEKEDTCGECGRSGTVKGWECTPGARLDTAPRYEAESYAPFRDMLPRRNRRAASGAKACYRMRNGSMVHVKPGCRCKP